MTLYEIDRQKFFETTKNTKITKITKEKQGLFGYFLLLFQSMLFFVSFVNFVVSNICKFAGVSLNLSLAQSRIFGNGHQ